MVVALRSPERVSSLIPVDNAPIDAALKSDFGKYIQGMRKIEDAHVTKQSDADSILLEFEKVGHENDPSFLSNPSSKTLIC